MSACTGNNISVRVLLRPSASQKIENREWTGRSLFALIIRVKSVILRIAYHRQPLGFSPLRQRTRMKFSQAKTVLHLRLRFDHKRVVTTLRACSHADGGAAPAKLNHERLCPWSDSQELTNDRSDTRTLQSDPLICSGETYVRLTGATSYMVANCSGHIDRRGETSPIDRPFFTLV